MKIAPLTQEYLDSINDPTSGRHKAKLGDTVILGFRVYKLVDKICYPVNKCPSCGSTNTYHHRIQRMQDVVGNCWNAVIHRPGNGAEHHLRKFDLCLDCRYEHLLETFIWKRIL